MAKTATNHQRRLERMAANQMAATMKAAQIEVERRSRTARQEAEARAALAVFEGDQTRKERLRAARPELKKILDRVERVPDQGRRRLDELLRLHPATYLYHTTD